MQTELGDRFGVRIQLYATPAQAFGPDASVPPGAKGFYHSGSNTIGLFNDALDSVRDLEETLNHEFFGHFGLNTLRPAAKFALLTSIARAQSNPFIRRAFEKVKTDQPKLANNDYKVAEEVFARAAEAADAFWTRVFDTVVSTLAPLLRRLNARIPLTLAEIRQQAC